MTIKMLDKESFSRIEKLVQLSGENILDRFEWPDTLPEDQPWMPSELLSIHNTEFEEKFSAAEKVKLSKLEALSFFSENFHGEVYLLSKLLEKYTKGTFDEYADFIYFFMKEEGDHIQVFSHFCRKYGQVMPGGRVDLGSSEATDVEDLLFFCRVLIFENHVDFINQKLGRSEEVPKIIRDINAYHCEDEARHVTFGSLMIKHHYNILKETQSESVIKEVNRYIEDYMLSTMELFYKTDVYKEMGIEDPTSFRIQLMKSPGRVAFHSEWLKRSCRLFQNIGVFENRTVEEILAGYFNTDSDNSRSNGYDDVVEWVKQQSDMDTEIDPDLNLFTAGLINSLKFMRLLNVIQEASGRSVVLEEVNLENLQTLNTIKNTYF